MSALKLPRVEDFGVKVVNLIRNSHRWEVPHHPSATPGEEHLLRSGNRLVGLVVDAFHEQIAKILQGQYEYVLKHVDENIELKDLCDNYMYSLTKMWRQVDPLNYDRPDWDRNEKIPFVSPNMVMYYAMQLSDIIEACFTKVHIDTALGQVEKNELYKYKGL